MQALPWASGLGVDSGEDAEGFVCGGPPPCEVGEDVCRGIFVVGADCVWEAVWGFGFGAEGEEGEELVSWVAGF